jgi:hypothetical protein
VEKDCNKSEDTYTSPNSDARAKVFPEAGEGQSDVLCRRFWLESFEDSEAEKEVSFPRAKKEEEDSQAFRRLR